MDEMIMDDDLATTAVSDFLMSSSIIKMNESSQPQFYEETGQIDETSAIHTPTYAHMHKPMLQTTAINYQQQLGHEQSQIESLTKLNLSSELWSTFKPKQLTVLMDPHKMQPWTNFNSCALCCDDVPRSRMQTHIMKKHLRVASSSCSECGTIGFSYQRRLKSPHFKLMGKLQSNGSPIMEYDTVDAIENHLFQVETVAPHFVSSEICALQHAQVQQFAEHQKQQSNHTTTTTTIAVNSESDAINPKVLHCQPQHDESEQQLLRLKKQMIATLSNMLNPMSSPLLETQFEEVIDSSGTIIHLLQAIQNAPLQVHRRHDLLTQAKLPMSMPVPMPTPTPPPMSNSDKDLCSNRNHIQQMVVDGMPRMIQEFISYFKDRLSNIMNSAVHTSSSSSLSAVKGKTQKNNKQGVVGRKRSSSSLRSRSDSTMSSSSASSSPSSPPSSPSPSLLLQSAEKCHGTVTAHFTNAQVYAQIWTDDALLFYMIGIIHRHHLNQYHSHPIPQQDAIFTMHEDADNLLVYKHDGSNDTMLASNHETLSYATHAYTGVFESLYNTMFESSMVPAARSIRFFNLSFDTTQARFNKDKAFDQFAQHGCGSDWKPYVTDIMWHFLIHTILNQYANTYKSDFEGIFLNNSDMLGIHRSVHFKRRKQSSDTNEINSSPPKSTTTTTTMANKYSAQQKKQGKSGMASAGSSEQRACETMSLVQFDNFLKLFGEKRPLMASSMCPEICRCAVNAASGLVLLASRQIPNSSCLVTNGIMFFL